MPRPSSFKKHVVAATLISSFAGGALAQGPFEAIGQAMIPASFLKSALEKEFGVAIECDPLAVSQGRSDADAIARIGSYGKSKGWRSLGGQYITGGYAAVFLRDASDTRKIAIGSVGADSMYAVLSCVASKPLKTAASAPSSHVKANLTTLPHTVHNTAALIPQTDFCKKYKCQVVKRTLEPEQFYPENERTIYKLSNGLIFESRQATQTGKVFSMVLKFDPKISVQVTLTTVKDFAKLTFGEAAAGSITSAKLNKCRTSNDNLLWFRPFKANSVYGVGLKCEAGGLMAASSG